MRSKELQVTWLAALLVSLLSGCGTTVAVKEEPSATKPPTERSPQAGESKRGGYYLDDGPGSNPPPDIDAIPDAVPVAEPLLARANRPYIALGEQYTPMTVFQPYKAQGIASWYGRRYHGQKTSSGEVYDMYGMTAAHPTLPIPSYVRVTNPLNSRSVVVRVNDRGPFKKDRLIDLSYAAAYKLRLVGKGSGEVEVEAIDAMAGAVQTSALPIEQVAQAEQASLPRQPVQPALNLEKSLNLPAAAGGSFVQAGAFRSKENADLLRDRLKQQNLVQNVAVENWYNGGIYRVRLGPYDSRDAAIRAAGEIRQSLGVSTLVITQ